MNRSDDTTIGPMTRRFLDRLAGVAGAFDIATELAPKVLIIEDNPSDAELLSHELEGLGCEVHRADEGVKGIGYVIEWRPAKMIFLDVRLPGISGVEVIRLLKLILPKQPICICTGFSSPEVEEAAKQYGCPILRKPASADDLKRIMESA